MFRTTTARTAAAALLGAFAASALAARTGHLAKLGRRTTVRTVRAGR
ncbi:hypothetical protein GCM10023201_24660 [Actinomycetospora corticicola]|uniref:Uncharacterized protein n=1 Tax=Actinomycetospora corticicola TaxID=663602 RepID=A0A7Y9DXL0_9PSEU|nr:hypothetical protein [Actinomycetospora corticicola]NYD37399.1 hypothetical protein [Actinomycetospora corticicola]